MDRGTDRLKERLWTEDREAANSWFSLERNPEMRWGSGKAVNGETTNEKIGDWLKMF